MFCYHSGTRFAQSFINNIFMSKKSWLIIGGIVLVALLWVGSAYNGLVGKNEAVDSQWAQVETQYQRRFDLIPSLVESVKGVMKQEQTIFDALAEARTRYSGAQTVDQKAAAAGQVEGALGRLLVIAENYPQLKSSENVQTLMAQLEGTENRISVERKRFNDSVQELNVAIKRFPTNILAGAFGFGQRTYFESAAGSENAPKVQF
jgi:LemA protein